MKKEPNRKTQIINTKKNESMSSQKVLQNNKKELEITSRVFSDENRTLESLLTSYLENMIDKSIKTMYDEKEVRAISKKEVA